MQLQQQRMHYSDSDEKHFIKCSLHGHALRVSQESRRSRALTSSSIIVCSKTPVFLSPIFINLSVALKGNCLPSPPPNPYDLRPPTRREVERGVSSRREARCQDSGGVGAW